MERIVITHGKGQKPNLYIQVFDDHLNIADWTNDYIEIFPEEIGILIDTLKQIKDEFFDNDTLAHSDR